MPTHFTENRAVLMMRNETNVHDFLPTGFVLDGSENYSESLNAAVSAAVAAGKKLVFGAGIFKVSALTPIILLSGLTVDATGATFLLDATNSASGSVFRGVGLSNIKWQGGRFNGQRDNLSTVGLNVRALDLDDSVENIIVDGIQGVNWPGNVLKIEGTNVGARCKNVSISNINLARCSTYMTYPINGNPVYPAGTSNADKGAVRLRYCDYVSVKNVMMSDALGEHMEIKECNHGLYSDGIIHGGTVGGVFLLSCHDWSINGVVVDGVGSRGITLALSSRCVVSAAVVSNSGRQGMRFEQSSLCRVTGSVFRENARLEEAASNNEILVDGPASNIAFRNNTVISRSTATAALLANGVSTNTEVLGNQFIGVPTIDLSSLSPSDAASWTLQS